MSDDLAKLDEEINPALAVPVTVGDMLTLAKRFRSRAYWCRDGFYSDAAELAQNAAIREAFEGYAQELDDLFSFSSELTQSEKKR